MEDGDRIIIVETALSLDMRATCIPVCGQRETVGTGLRCNAYIQIITAVVHGYTRLAVTYECGCNAQGAQTQQMQRLLELLFFRDLRHCKELEVSGGWRNGRHLSCKRPCIEGN